MREPNPTPSVASGTRRRRRNHQTTMPRVEEGSHDDDRESDITPRTRRRKQFRWLQQRRKSRDKYGRKTNVLRRIDHDDGESSLLPPVEALSKRTLPMHEAVYLSDTSQEEPVDDDSSMGSESFLIGDKEHPIFLDGCVFDAGGMILDAIKELTESPPELSREIDRTNGQRRDHDPKSPWSSAKMQDMEKSTERTALSLDDKTFHAILEMASENGSPKDPDLQRAIDLNRLLDETYRQSRDNFRRRLRERRLQSSSGRDQPVTPTALRSPNEILESVSPTPRSDPLTPSFLRSPVSDGMRSEADGVAQPDDLILTPTSLGANSGSRLGPNGDAADQSYKPRPSNAPVRLSIHIPSDDESFDNDSCSKSLASATTVPRHHSSGKHHQATGSARSQPRVRSPADKAALLLSRISSEETEHTGIFDKHAVASSQEQQPLKRELLSVNRPEALAKDLDKSVGAPSPSELLEARTYLSDFSRVPDSPSPKILKDVRRFFDQILQSDSPRAPQSVGPSPANSKKQRHAATTAKSKLIGPSPESNWNRCQRKPQERQHMRVQESSASHKQQSSAKAIAASVRDPLTSHKQSEIYQHSSLREILSENMLATTDCRYPCLNSEKVIPASGLNRQFALGSEQSLRHLRRGHSLVYSTSASEGEQEMALKLRLLETMRSEASMKRYSSHAHAKRRRRSHSPVTRRRKEHPGPVSHAASFDSIPGSRLIQSALPSVKQNNLDLNQPGRTEEAFLSDRKCQSEESSRDNLVEILSVDSSFDWYKVAPVTQNDTKGAVVESKESIQRYPKTNKVQADVFPGILRRGYGLQNDETGDGATDAIIEIISSADSFACDLAQQARGTKFPPFSILPEIPEVYSSEGEAGMDAELFLRKKHANMAQPEGSVVPVSAHNHSQSLSGALASLHGISGHRKGSVSHSESIIPVLEIVSSSEGGAFTQSLLIPRLGGPEECSLKNVAHMQSISDVSSQQTFDQSTSLRNNALDYSFQRAPMPSSTPAIAIPHSRTDEKMRQSKKNKNCPASYIRPPVNCGKEDAPGVTFLEIVKAGRIELLECPEGFRFSEVQDSERGSGRATAGSLWLRTKDNYNQASIEMAPNVPGQATDHKVKAGIPIVSGKDIVGSRRQEESAIIVLDSSLDIAGPFEFPSKDVDDDMPRSSINQEVLQSCQGKASEDSLWQEKRETNVSSIFRGLSTFLYSGATKKKNQSFPSTGAGTKESPFSILESIHSPSQRRDCPTAFRFSNEGHLVEMTQIEEQTQDNTRNSGIVLLQPNINIYAANPTSASLHKVDNATVPVLSAPGSADRKCSATEAMRQQDTNVHETALESKQLASKPMQQVKSTQGSTDSSGDEHTVIYIDDISSYSEPLGRVEPTQRADTLAVSSTYTQPKHKKSATKTFEEERTATMQQELKIVSTSVKNLEHKIAQVDKILSRAIESVTESIPLTEPAISTLDSQSVGSNDEDDDGLQNEINNLAESEESLRRELDILRCLPNDDGADQLHRDHKFISSSDTAMKGTTEINTTLPSRDLESVRRMVTSSYRQKSLSQDLSAELLETNDGSPVRYLNTKSPANQQLMSTSKVQSSARAMRQASEGSRMNFAVLHSRLQENIEIIYLDESGLRTDEELEEIEAIFVEESFVANDFFKYGEPKGMVFDWIRPNTNGIEGHRDEGETRPWQMKPPTSKPLDELKTDSIPKAIIAAPESSSDCKETSQVPIQCMESPPRHTKASVNPSSQQSLQYMGKEVISLLDIDDIALEQPIFRERSNTGPLHITPRVSSLTNCTGSRTGLDPDDSLTDSRPRRYVSDPPATGISFVPNSMRRLNEIKEILQSETMNDNDADLTNLKRRVEAILSRSRDTSLALSRSRTDSPDDECTKSAANDDVSGCDDLSSKRDSKRSSSRADNLDVEMRDEQLKEFIARGKSLIESNKGGACRNRAADEGVTDNDGNTHSIFSFDHVLDEADRILSNIGVTNGFTTGASQSTLSEDDDTNTLSQAEMRRHFASRLHVDTAPSFPDLLAPLTLTPAPVHQTLGSASNNAPRFQSGSKATMKPSNPQREDKKTHRRANRKASAGRSKSGTVEITKSSASPRARTKVYQWKLGKSLTRAIRKKTEREGASRVAGPREAACPRTVAESDDSPTGEKLPSKLFFVPL